MWVMAAAAEHSAAAKFSAAQDATDTVQLDRAWLHGTVAA